MPDAPGVPRRDGADADRPPGRIAGNAGWLVAGEVAAKLASLVFVVIVARALGVREYGWFTFATAFVPLLLIVGSLGLHQAVVRSLVRRPERTAETFASGLVVRTVTAVLAVAAAGALAPVLLEDRLAVVTVVVVGAALGLDSVTSYAASIFEAHGSVRPYATAFVINRVGATALALAAYAAGYGLVPVLVAYLLGSLAAALYAARAVRRAHPSVAWRAARAGTARALVREGAPLGVAALLNMALLRADTLLVAALLTTVDVALYGIAFRFYESFLFLAFALGDAAFPRYAHHGPGPATARVAERVLALTLSAYAPLFVLSLFAAPWAVELLFGARYADAAPAVPYLTLATVFFAFTYQARSATVATGGSGAVPRVAAVALTVNVGLNLVLIPREGIVGAAAATAVACAVEALLTGWALRRQGVGLQLGAVLPAPLLAAGATAALLAGADLRGGAAVLVGGCAYAAALALCLAVLPGDHLSALRARVRRPA